MNSDSVIRMEPIRNQKRPVCSYLPYKKEEEAHKFYLQMRDSNAKTHPNMFAAFGGGIEQGETSEEGLMREILEELAYKPTKYRYFSRYESGNTIFDLYIEEVSDDFESKVTVGEGEYGKFLSYEETQQLPNVSNITRLMIENLEKFLATN
jgi:8-oxo-dGTP pyrophosphatase MutT (NUDIX family)